MNLQVSFERILASLHKAVLDDSHWVATSALIDDACEAKGNHLVFRTAGQDDGITTLFMRFCYRGEHRRDLEREYLANDYPTDEHLPLLRRLPANKIAHVTTLFPEARLKLSATWLLDLQRVAGDDLPYRNLLRAVARLEQNRSPQDVLRVLRALRRWWPNWGAEELERAFVDWVRQIAERLAPAGASVPLVRTLEEASMTLVERVAEWPEQWIREGHEQGVAEGREQGRAQGVAEGREQGREQGVDQQRALLCRMAATRFGADTASRLANLLAPITDPERLAEVGDWLVRCDTAARFLARFDTTSPS